MKGLTLEEVLNMYKQGISTSINDGKFTSHDVEKSNDLVKYTKDRKKATERNIKIRQNLGKQL